MASYASPTRSSQFKSRIPASTASSVRLGNAEPPRTPDSNNANSARKRSRFDSSDGKQHFLSPRSSPAIASPYPTLSSVARSHVAPSPPPLANAQYRLAGGLDSPAQSTGYQHSPFNSPPEIDFRKRWSSTPIVDRINPGVLSREGNGHKRTHTDVMDEASESWKDYVLRVAGGVAGKVWEFAAGGFKGFSAGGGTSYQMTDSGFRPFDDNDPWLKIPSNVPREASPPPRTDSPVPGAFPREVERPKKRLQTSQGTDWVIVDQQDNQPAPSPFTPRVSSYAPTRSIAASTYKYHTPRLSSTRSQASLGRRPRMAIPRAASVAGLGSPRSSNQTSSASYAQPRSPHHSPRTSVNTPSEPTVQRSPQQRDIDRWSAKRDREQRQADASMSRLNRQLQDMIAQGKAALETRYEVTEDEDDYTNDYPMLNGEDGHESSDYAIPKSAASPRARW